MSKTTFHHTCMLVGSREVSAECENFYKDNFGMGLAYSGLTDGSDYIFLSDNVNSERCPFEIIGSTIEKREDDFLTKYGPGLDHICFIVEDLQKVYEELTAAGVYFYVPPYEFQGTHIAWCKDPAGVDIEVLQIDKGLSGVKVETQAPKGQYNHVCILAGSRELAQTTEDFYRKHFGFKEILRGGPSEEMDWVYLSDSEGTPLWLEIVGKPIYDNEKAYLDKNGPGIEHHCFVVENADVFYQWLKEKGVELETEVMDFSGARMFFLRDPVGIRIQVLQMPEVVGL